MSIPHFADVILPLPIYSSFTYSIPEFLENEVQVGSRVLVNFGKKKFFTGIVEAIHTNKPKDYETKPLTALLDAEPILRYPQLNFWKWMAEYYLCSPGEVFKAAVPTGLKPESETRISLNPDYEPDPEQPFRPTESQALIIMVAQENRTMTVAELEASTGIRNVSKALMPLLDVGILEIAEHISDKYRPKKIQTVSLTIERNDSETLHEFFDKVKRSKLQEKALL
ncbi:MAG: primosomal protein N', partial [Muribaculaceae bacterium]|nr:primosomal protein N' [Muribaculaceae bacterium]